RLRRGRLIAGLGLVQPSGGGRGAGAEFKYHSHADLTSRLDFEARSLARLSDEQRRQASKIVKRSTLGRRRQHLDGDVIGPAVVMPVHLAGDLLLIAPGDHGIEGPVGAWRRQVVLGPPEPDQVLPVV